MELQYAILPPLLNKTKIYYQKYNNKILEEILFLIKSKKLIFLNLTVYDLIDEYDRVTKELIIQKKRIEPVVFIKNLKTLLQKNNINISKLKFTLIRAIRQNETKEDLLEWIINNANDLVDNIVFVGNFKNKILTTDIAIDYVISNNPVIKKYGSVVIFHRKNEYERCIKRKKLGIDFFVSQIIIDKISETEIDNIIKLNIPIFITITPLTSYKLLNILKGLGVIFNDININNKFDDVSIASHLNSLIQFIIEKKQKISYEIFTPKKSKRLQLLNILKTLIF